MPSVCATVRVSLLLPQPANTAVRASSMRTRTTTARSLDPGHGGARAATLVLLEDAAQPPQRLAGLAPHPAAVAEGLHQPVRRQGGLRLEHEADAGAAAGGGLERPLGEGLDAVELAAAPDPHDAAGPLDLGEVHVAPREALERRVHAEASARPTAVGVLPRE